MSPYRKITRLTIADEDRPAFIFLGVVSSEPDYRLSVMLNRYLGTELRKDLTDIKDTSTTGTNTFSRFTDTHTALSLVSNRNEGSILIRKLKNIDFLLVIHGEPDKKRAEELAVKLRSVAEVTAVFVFDSREISDRNIALLAG